MNKDVWTRYHAMYSSDVEKCSNVNLQKKLSQTPEILFFPLIISNLIEKEVRSFLLLYQHFM